MTCSASRCHFARCWADFARSGRIQWESEEADGDAMECRGKGERRYYLPSAKPASFLPMSTDANEQ